MSQAPVLPMFVDAMIGDTLQLDAEEFGAYHLILYATWRANGQPLADDDEKMARLCRMPVARWKKVRKGLEPFFDLSGGTWRQGRLEREWARVAEAAERARKNGRGGGRPPKTPPQPEPSGNPVGYSWDTQNEPGSKAPLTLTKPNNPLPPSESTAARAAEDAVLGMIDDLVRSNFGMASPRHQQDRAIVQGWIEQGMSLEAIRSVVEPIIAGRAKAGQDAPGTLKFFLNPMVRAIASGATRPTLVPADPEREAAAKRYTDALNRWHDDGRQGPAPKPEDFGMKARAA